MPTINVNRDLLFERLGETYTDKEFEQLCFDFGLELDEVTSEKLMITKEQGTTAENIKAASEDIIYRIDIPANRYDLLCLEGLVRGLLVFQNKIPTPKYTLSKPESMQTITCTKSTTFIRQFIVGAVLRNIKFTKQSYASFIDLQDKLHQNICRKRTLVAIGTHDLDTIEGPFTYDALSPGEIKFKPLNHDKVLNGTEIIALYKNHAQLKQYLPIIENSHVYPVIYDKNNVVLSLPPIINGDHSKIKVETTNVLIECTATDLRKAEIVLDTIVCMFSEYCAVKYEVEPVQIVMHSGAARTYPILEHHRMQVKTKLLNGYLGIRESEKSIANLLSKMSLDAVADNDRIDVIVPPTRHDILHACDIYEDAAIAFGYNNIPKKLPRLSTIGRQLPINKMCDLLRGAIAQVGFDEALTFTLCSRDDISTKLGYEIDNIQAVHISNPKTLEFQVARTTLIPGLLKTIASNKKMPLPLKLFEISDVVLFDAKTRTGARNERHFAAVNCNKTAGFEVVHGLLDRFMQLLSVAWTPNSNVGYYLTATDDVAYFPQRCANVICYGKVIGKIGVLHPSVLNNFEISNPCACVEINVEQFV